MQAAWRLAINSLSQRPSRSILLILAVALCSALIAAVGCSMASVTAAIKMRIESTVGAADLRIKNAGGTTFDASVIDIVKQWPDAAVIVPRLQDAPALRNERTGKTERVVAFGIDPVAEFTIRPTKLAEGRLVEKDGEILIDNLAAGKLEAKVGDVLDVERFGDPIRLTVVGISKQGPLGAIVDRQECFVTLATAAKMAERPNKINTIEIKLKEGVDHDVAYERYKSQVPAGLSLQQTEKITSGVYKNIESNQIGLYIASVLSFLAAAFIIMTGMTTGITERTRELAVLRCVGATKGQLAIGQLAIGTIVGALGAMIGVPLGMLGAYVLVSLFPDQIPSGFRISPIGLTLGALGAIVAGLIGSTFPAIVAARISPLQGLSIRARVVAKKWVVLALVGGVVLPLVSVAILTLPRSSAVVFWGHVTAGLPALLTGWFLLAVPVTWVIGRALSPVLSKVLALPPHLLSRTIRATPFRHGFTAGAMMIGLSMMVAIWTNGRAVLRDWLDELQIPDAYVAALPGSTLKAGTLERIAQATLKDDPKPFVEQICAVTLQSAESSAAIGIEGLTKYRTTFVGFDPKAFFAMSTLKWFAPTDKAQIEAAIEALERGEGILIARELQVSRKIGVGDKISLKDNGAAHTFTVLGVVGSPGLDIVSKFHNVDDNYVDQALGAVFGNRADLVKYFNNDAVSMLILKLREGVDASAAMGVINRMPATGILYAGTAIEVKKRINDVIGGSLVVFSLVAIGAMLIACLAVANLILASVQARQYEFGVLRALGAQRGMLGRLVIGEALIIAVAACLLGTALGLQAGWSGQRVYMILIGLELSLNPPWGAIALGCGCVLVITLMSSAPTAFRLVRRAPRELLAAVKG